MQSLVSGQTYAAAIDWVAGGVIATVTCLRAPLPVKTPGAGTGASVAHPTRLTRTLPCYVVTLGSVVTAENNTGDSNGT